MTAQEILSNIIEFIKTGIPNNVKSSNLRTLLTWIQKRVDVQEPGRLKIVKSIGNLSIELEIGDRVTGIVEDTFIQHAIYLGGNISLLSSYFIISNEGSTNPRENIYEDINSTGQLLDDQANQTQGFYQQVNDASDDPDVDEGKAVYVYLGTTNGNLDDYIRLSDAEINLIESNNYKSFNVKAINTTIDNNCSIGQILVKTNGSDNVTAFLFDANYSKLLTRNKVDLAAGNDIYLIVDNTTLLNRTIYKISNISFSDVTNTHYLVEVSPTESATNFNVSDKVEVLVYNDNSASGYTIPTEEQVIGSAIENTSLTGAVNLSLTSLSHARYSLSGNTSLTLTNLLSVSQSTPKTMVVNSIATQTFTITNATHVYGEYLADGTVNFISIVVANTPVKGLEIHVFYNQPL